ncbi:RNA polymerase sigma factor [Larkinella harenae]
MQSLEDQVYIDRVKSGDLTAYAFLVDKYKNMAYTIALRILTDPYEAEDLAQESFVKAYLQISSFQNKSKFSTWLYTIVYRSAVSKLKISHRKFLALDEQFLENETATLPTDPLITSEREQYVKEAIKKLPKLESLVITLFYFEENSVEEIEAITGLSKSNIKVKLFRARKTLEKELHFLL